jgi:two-component system, OmpR family, sensor histidine kinase TorS
MTQALTGDNRIVWVVEDDPYTLKICLRLLEKNGVACRGFASAEELLIAADRPENATILTDIHLPGISGRELCTRLKHEQPAWRLIALDTSLERVSLLHAGFDDVLPKPFTEQSLLEILGARGGTELNFPLLEQLIEDEDERNAILQRFHSDTVNDLGALEAAIDENHAENAAFFVHRLAGRLGQMDRRELDAQLRGIETRFGNGETIEQLLPEIRRSTEAIRTFLGKLHSALSSV